MFFVDLPPSESLPPHLHPVHTPPAEVWRIPMGDESFSPALRGRADGSAVLNEVSEQSFLEWPRAELVMAAAWIRQELLGLAEGLADPALRSRFLDPQISLAELIEVMHHVTPEQRVGFAAALARGAAGGEAEQFFTDKLDNIIRAMSLSERVAAADCFLAAGRGEWVVMLLRCSRDQTMLEELVTTIGAERLLALGAEARECVAQARVGGALRGISFSLEGCTDIHGMRSQLEGALNEVVNRCLAHPDLLDSATTRHFVLVALDDLRQLGEDLARAASVAETAEVLRVHAASAALEFRYGVNIRRGEGDLLDRECEHAEVITGATGWLERALIRPPAGWREQDIADICAVLERIPEGILLFTDLLRDIEYVDTLGWGVLGARYHADGRIKIAAAAIDNHEFVKHYGEVSSLAIVLAHEIGHGLQIGDGAAGFSFAPGGEGFAPGEAAIDFDEYAALSGWRMIARARVAAGRGDGTVVIDGQEYSLKEPARLDGELVNLVYDPFRQLLLTYHVDAEFTARWYSRVNPWEDFAEAFSCYLMCPEKLIAEAPRKFAFFEREFGRYRGSGEIETRLRGRTGD